MLPVVTLCHPTLGLRTDRELKIISSGWCGEASKQSWSVSQFYWLKVGTILSRPLWRCSTEEGTHWWLSWNWRKWTCAGPDRVCATSIHLLATMDKSISSLNTGQTRQAGTISFARPIVSPGYCPSHREKWAGSESSLSKLVSSEGSGVTNMASDGWRMWQIWEE